MISSLSFYEPMFLAPIPIIHRTKSGLYYILILWQMLERKVHQIFSVKAQIQWATQFVLSIQLSECTMKAATENT